MTNDPYTETDLRHEAARQYAAILHAPDLAEVGEEMYGQPIPSTVAGQTVRWRDLSGDDWHDARNGIHEHLEDAVDLSRWAVDLGACALTRTTELAWGHPKNWDLAVQVAHRRGLKDDLHDALTEAIRGAVRLVLDNRGIGRPEIQLHATPEEATR